MVAMWPPAADGREWPLLRIVLLISISIFTVAVAVKLADKLAVIASLAGSLFVMITSVLFPAAVHLALTWNTEQKETALTRQPSEAMGSSKSIKHVKALLT